MAALARSADRVVWAMAGIAVAISALAVGLDPLGLALVAAAGAPWAVVVAGRRPPLVAFVAAVLAPAAALVVAADAKPVVFFAVPTCAWVALRTAAFLPNAVAVAGGLGLVVVDAAEKGASGSSLWSGSAVWVIGVAYGTTTGYVLRRAHDLAVELDTANDRLVAAATSDERRRIAQDVHDVVAHSLAVTLLNISGARAALRRDPLAPAADEALARAEQVGRDSLGGIRHVVGLLRDHPGDAGRDGPGGPLPDAHDLPDLVAGYRRSGLPVALAVEPGPPALDRIDPVAGSVVFRVVREALANVTHHATGAESRVRVEVGPAAVDVVVANDLPARPPTPPDRGARRRGLGLAGLAERVHALGGAFAAGPGPSGTWRVEATVPLRSPLGAP